MSTDPKLALLEKYALVARALSAPARLSILEQLAQGERGVESLAEKTGLATANCSQHLQQLRRSGLVTSRRAGKTVIYRLTDAKTLEMMELLHSVAQRNLAQVGDILRGLLGSEDAPEPISRQDLDARLGEGSVTLLDIRPADEYAAGHIPGALNITLAQIEHVLSTIAPDTEIVAYCRGPFCVLAHQAVAILRRHGLMARRLDGGLPEWRADGRAVVEAKGLGRKLV